MQPEWDVSFFRFFFFNILSRVYRSWVDLEGMKGGVNIKLNCTKFSTKNEKKYDYFNALIMLKIGRQTTLH